VWCYVGCINYSKGWDFDMPRTKAPKFKKSKRTKMPANKNGWDKPSLRTQYQKDFWSRPVISPLGGFLINPPLHCPKPVYHPDEVDVCWADLAFCQHCCPYSTGGNKGDGSCERNRWFKKASDLERAKEWAKWRVKAFSFGPHNEKNTCVRTKFPKRRNKK